MKKKILIVIPARFHSTRFKGKPLCKILGKEMILRVAEACSKVIRKSNVIIATDNKKIFNLVNNNNFKCVMTCKNNTTGTDRVAEVAKKLKASIYINVQGDEPLVKPVDIKSIINEKIKYPNKIICGYSRILNIHEFNNLNIPKVVFDQNNELIYISRAPIPSSKKIINIHHRFKQVCIYAFNKKELMKFKEEGKKSMLEKIEDIEILRFLDLGFKIKMKIIRSNTHAVDVKKDITIVENFLRK